MAKNCSYCGEKLTFRDSFVWDKKPVCRACLNNLEQNLKVKPELGESTNEAADVPRMEIAEILFSFKGRVPRATFWAIFLPIVVINIIAISLIASSGDVPGEVGAVFGLVLFIECWVMLATQVKRYHDMDISGWMVLINAIPYLGSVIAILWLGCGKGTDGPNKFGEGPLISRRQS